MDSHEDGDTVVEHLNRTDSTQQAATWRKAATDYHGALVRLVTMRAEKKQYLLFGYVELFPRDIPVPESFNAGEKPWAVPNFGGDVTLAVSARKMSIVEALAWYEAAAQGCVTIPLPVPIELAAPSLGVEPSLGLFSVGETVPFAAQWHDRPRIHRLVPMTLPTEAVLSLGSSTAAREWLTANAGFDPFDYEEWLASLSLIAPDPLLTGVSHFALERNPDGSECVVLQAHRRRYEYYPDADADALNIVLLQRRPSGWAEIMPTSLDSDGFAIKNYPEPVSETGYAISCPIRGLLRMVPPTMWIGQISVGLGVVNTVFDVEVPSGGRRKPAARYLTTRLNEAGGVQVGEALPHSGAIRIVELQEARKDRIKRQSAPQRLFGSYDYDKEELSEDELKRMRSEAEAYVADLVAMAQCRVIFVDPDFGVREFQNYALRVMRDGVTVKILTGAPHMRKARPIDDITDTSTEEQTAPSAPPGILLLRQLQSVQRKLGPGAPEVFVMPGSRKPIFHDRFLVTDDIVWASGPSFNELGERIGIISQVHEPRNVIAAVELTLSRATPLAKWVDENLPKDSNGDRQ
ncbi:VPA1262 family N-terminal domain-containing protein [Acidithiobacillus thiooxidans]|uniref:Uncharacterized protein n=1 Tax=Acidithiobacillus thiooxidans TaxID=930 RepID=A0A1C2I5T4_ACITH|nr:VPA1262 family N-terminal domain-containing protein [Acidithiobacillus thiooxidans]OCX71344.1 hypothetical protein A6M23_12000 [Acidithiobacillus thiooxidans]OCX83589.1 hypothetical protein A6P08_10260 [Acidithiobacillus thiooxidans]